MKNIFKTTFTSAVTGIGIGMPITILCMTLIGGFNEVLREFLVWLVASALYGIISAVLFMSKAKLHALAVAVIHCVCCFAVTIAAATINGYSESILELILAIGPVFVIVYAVIYLGSLIMMKIQAKKANDALEKK